MEGAISTLFSSGIFLAVVHNIVPVHPQGLQKELQLLHRGGCPTRTHYPANNALLANFRLNSDAEIFVTKHRLSIRVWVPDVQKHVRNAYVITTELPLCAPPLAVGRMHDVRHDMCGSAGQHVASVAVGT